MNLSNNKLLDTDDNEFLKKSAKTDSKKRLSERLIENFLISDCKKVAVHLTDSAFLDIDTNLMANKS